MEPGYPALRERLIQMADWDLDCYKIPQLARRLRSLLTRTKVQSLAEYADLLAREPSRIRELSDLLTINVSEFFRNPERFEVLEKRFIPPLVSGSPRIWSAGCANGSEAYSLAMLFEDAKARYSILATDIDLNILDTAKRGVYSEREIAGISRERCKSYIRQSGDAYAVSDSLKAKIRFQKHNLLSDPYPSGLDLICCRNVLIYFTEEAKHRVVRQFCDALKPGGILFLGSTETIFNGADLGFTNIAPFFYQKPNKAVN